MTCRSTLVAFAMITIGCAPSLSVKPSTPSPVQPRVVTDFAGIDAWLVCARREGVALSCEAASAASLGGRHAVLAASTFGEPPADVPMPTVEAVASLVAAMKAWPDAVAAAAQYLPEPAGGGPIHAFVVGNGAAMGDAYVEGFAGEGEALRVSETGERVILLNPIRIAAAYPGDASAQATQAFGVMAHEIFHVLFQRYRDRAPAWTSLATNASAEATLQILVLDEGIAHFIARRERLEREGFPKDHAEPSFAALSALWDRLQTASSADAPAIVRSASQGSYWSKSGSITGMLLAHGVMMDRGPAGLHEAVRCGPARLVELYAAATTRHPELTPLPDGLRRRAWIDLCPR